MSRGQTPTIVLGFDFGTRRIGIATGNTITGQAQALTALSRNGGPDWPGVTRIIAEWRPQALVVGLPLRADGSAQPITRQARDFMRDLSLRFDLPVHEMDERFSTLEAAERLRSARATGRRKTRLTKGDADAVAAQVILESWLATAGCHA